MYEPIFPQRHGTHVRGNAAFMLEAVKLQEKSLLEGSKFGGDAQPEKG